MPTGLQIVNINKNSKFGIWCPNHINKKFQLIWALHLYRNAANEKTAVFVIGFIYFSAISKVVYFKNGTKNAPVAHFL